MAMVCPQCGSAYDQRLQCPNCEARLLFKQSSATSSPTLRWRQTPSGRILIGLLLAQGVYWGLRHLCTAALLGLGGEELHDLWSTWTGVWLSQGLQVLGIILGGMLAGAGQRQGLFYGAVLGISNGLLCLLIQQESPVPIPLIALYALPLIHTGLGGLSGSLGSWIWKPLPPLVGPVHAQPRRQPRPTVPQPQRDYFAGPLHWVRVLIGSVIAVTGTLCAEMVLNMAITNGGRIKTEGQAQLVLGELMALAMLAGSALAGATTSNGCKQGLAVGVTTAVLLSGIRLGMNTHSIDILLLTAISAIILGVVGGGFGTQLLPPVVGTVRRPGVGIDPV